METVEVFADVLCPFTHVGLRTLVDRRNDRGLDRPRLRIRARPLESVNGVPLDAGHIAAEVEALRASVRPDLFAGFAASTFPGTSMAAFALSAAFLHPRRCRLVLSGPGYQPRRLRRVRRRVESRQRGILRQRSERAVR